jgi:predicted DNA-binding protein (UPF0251 family)
LCAECKAAADELGISERTLYRKINNSIYKVAKKSCQLAAKKLINQFSKPN